MIAQCTKQELLQIYKAAIDFEFKELTKEQQHNLKAIFASAIIIIDTLWTDDSKKFYADDETGKRGLID